MFRGAALALLLVLLAQPLHAQTCRDFEAIRSCALQNTGAEPVEKFLARGDEVIRIITAKGNGIIPAIVMLDLIMPKEGPGQLILRDPNQAAFSATHLLDRTSFAEIREGLLSLRGNGALLHGAAPIHGEEKRPENVETICLDAPSALVDVVIDGKTGSADLSYCEDEDVRFVAGALMAAAEKEPVCKPLFTRSWRGYELKECLYMRGNRGQAIQAYQAANRLMLWKDKDGPGDDEAAQMIAPNAVLSVSGSVPVSRRPRVMAGWISFRGDGADSRNCYPTGATARSNIITVDGRCGRSVRGDFDHDAKEFEAPMTEIWRMDADGVPRLSEWRIGRFAQTQ